MDISYSERLARLLSLDPLESFGGDWLDYGAAGLSAADAPELIRMSLDLDLHWSEEGSLACGPIHAWRALGQFGAREALAPLLEFLDENEDDDWAREDFPIVFSKFGSPALPDLMEYLHDPERNPWGRMVVADAMKRIAVFEPLSREVVVATLTKQLQRWYRSDDVLNAFIIAYLVELGAREAIPLMEEAFQGEGVDIDVGGDWEDVQIELGLLSERLTPRPQPRFGSKLTSFEPTSNPISRVRKPAVEKTKRKAARVARRRNRRRK